MLPSICRGLLCAFLVLLTSHSAPSAPPSPDETRPARLAWWTDARFGMFIHWGLYAIPAGQWNGQLVSGPGEWIMNNAHIPVADYEPLAARFNPAKFDADQWVSTAKRAGMKYLVITAKHHDGFCLFDSKLTTYDVIDATPLDRDIMREIADACRAQGIRVGWYYSIMDWHHPDARGENFPRYVEYLRGQVTELLSNYGPIDIMWFDGEWIPEWTPEYGDALYQLCLELQPNIIVNNRVGKGRAGMGNSQTSTGDFGTPEQEVPARDIPGLAWETCMTLNDTWGFRSDDNNWKYYVDLVHTLSDITSKGGNFLLNVGPTADGVIPQISVNSLRGIGNWLRQNGDAIYNTSPGPFKRRPWGGCTTSHDGRILYIHIFDMLHTNSVDLSALRNPIVKLWRVDDPNGTPPTLIETDGRRILAWPYLFSPQEGMIFALQVDGAPDVIEVPLRQSDDGSITLAASDAEVTGSSARYESGSGHDNIGFWTNPSDVVWWDVEVARPARFDLFLDYACAPGFEGSEFTVSIGPDQLPGSITSTGSWTSFTEIPLGPVDIPAPGKLHITVTPRSMPHGAVMNLRHLRLIPSTKP